MTGKVMLAAGLLLISSAGSYASECGDITIANMPWQSGELLASVDKVILENGFGCTAEIVEGDTVPTITSMVEKGQPDIMGEAWIDLVPEILNRGLAEKRIVQAANVLSDGGMQGWFIPKYVADDHPDIRTVDDALKHPKLFASPEDPSKGALFNGPTGSGSSVVSTQLFKAYGAKEAGFDLIETGTVAGLDGSLVKAYERHEGWLGYYWSPTALLGKYDMVRLDPGVPHDSAEWKRCTSMPECQDPHKNAWSTDRVVTLLSTKLEERAGPDVMGYLNTRSWDNKTVNAIMAWMSDNQATGEEGARHFLKDYEDVWTHWVKPEVADKIRAAIN